MQHSTTKKFDALTGARWLFATLVFLYHNRKYWRNDVNKYVLQLLNELHIGVSLFFVLSGFLIAYRYNSKDAAPVQYKEYAILRMARILPLYWLILLVSYIDWGFPKTSEAVLTFSLLHGFSNQHNLDGLAQAWSLTVEMTFYVFAPLLFIFWNKHIAKGIILMLTLLGIVTAAGQLWHAVNGNKQQFFYPFSFVLHSTFFGRFTSFAAGIWLAGMLQQRHKNIFKNIPYKTMIGFAGVMASVFVSGFFQPDIFHHGYESTGGAIIQFTLVPLFAILWFYGMITENNLLSKFFASRLLVLLGNASFAFYLVHISYVNIRIRGWKLFGDRNYIILWIVSILLYLLFEKPVNDWCRKVMKRKKQPISATGQPPIAPPASF